ncbi:Myc-type, basic helix-loop-helix (bHLH) domain containing protein [Trema orientale]|uniref:Myc-type, basic helix-loop-helix (BHLH) domain containing protein n=1 Tax=Trema orientale TaxID=63057 RepID=A0A2P5BMX2_TREOI|nr:Myc-type, basic helix-loop-helix (bHLH) domain containing protein [Trema orientale]
MAEEFQIQGGICGGNWWGSSRSMFTVAASPCSVGSLGWPSHDMLDIKAAGAARSSSSSGEETDHNIFQEVAHDQDDDNHDHHNNIDQKPHLQITADNSSVTGSASILIDSTLQMMGFGLLTSPISCTSSDFTNQTFVSRSSGRAESNNIYSMLQQDMGSTNKLNYRQEFIGLDSSQIQKDWSTSTNSTSPPKDFSAVSADVVDVSINGFKPNIIQQDLSGLDQASSGNCMVTSQALSAGFPAISAPFGYTSATLLQNLFEGETDSTHQQSYCNNYPSSGANYGSSTIWPRFSPLILGSRTSPPPPPPLKQQQQQQPGALHFTNNTAFWNASSPGLPNDGVFPSTTLPPPPRYVTQKFEEKPKCNSLITSAKANSNEDVHDSGSVTKKSNSSSNGSDQPVLKRPRIETPSPLPTFKVRKEKLGDRITALQQLVSPFGKTDTASVLHEAIEYIKFLHDQVSGLSTPYMKNNNGTSIPVRQQGSINKLKDHQDESSKQDLKSRGLCLVPISSTFPVANETTADFWTPTSSFGGTFMR